MTRISNWGRYPEVEAELLRPRSDEEWRAALEEGGPAIPRGLGRCYGDSALASRILSTRGMDRVLHFDPRHGSVDVEAGVSLSALIGRTLEHGWFPPVVPGTQFVTVGGAIASDIHGKNHHRVGTFGRHVEWIDLLLPSGEVRRVSHNADPESLEGTLFEATLGGMGLTGVILAARLRLAPAPSAWIRQETVATSDLDGSMEAFEAAADASFSVAWIDVLQRGSKLGRSVLYTGRWAQPGEASEAVGTARGFDPAALPERTAWSVPISLPSVTLNRWTVGAFNRLYHWKGRRSAGKDVVSCDSFFFPLDSVHHWNRIYGARGFVQYQFVFPEGQAREGLVEVLERVARAGSASFLAVLKKFGPQGRGMLSFPRPGWTLALDFPVRPRSFELLDELDRIVVRRGGRIYLTKDARMGREVFEAGYPRLSEFRAVRERVDPRRALGSLQSVRLGL